MGRYQLVIFHNPVAGQEDEFNRWLDDDHVPALLAVDGVVAAERARLIFTSRPVPGMLEHLYLSRYEIESDDVSEFHAHLMAGKDTRSPSAAVDRANNSARYFVELYTRRSDRGDEVSEAS